MFQNNLCSLAMIVICVAKKLILEVILTTNWLGGIIWRHMNKNHRYTIIEQNDPEQSVQSGYDCEICGKKR